MSSASSSQQSKLEWRGLLPYHRKVIKNVIENTNSLCIMGKGLGIEHIVAYFLKLYLLEPKNLIFVINFHSQEEAQFYQELITHITVPQKMDSSSYKKNFEFTCKIINSNDFTQQERQNLYQQGGVYFVTSRILSVDFLTNRIPLELLSGIVVLHSHQITETSNEAFIVNLYRRNHKSGFLKAFSDEPYSFTRGINQVEKIMRMLFLKDLLLWPINHEKIAEDFAKHEPEVIEVTQPLSRRVKAIQDAILRVITSTLDEIIKNNRGLDLSDFTVENCLFKSFDFIIRTQLEPIWNKISRKTKHLIEELGTLRRMLLYLTKYDCVSFYNYIETIRLAETSVSGISLGIPKSNWMLTDSAADIFMNAKARVYEIKTVESPVKKQKTLTQMANPTTSNSISHDVTLKLEENMKWKCLSEILDEIEDIINESSNSKLNSTVLILSADDKTNSQIQKYLTMGGKGYLIDMLKKTLLSSQSSIISKNTNFTNQSNSKNSKSKVNGKSKVKRNSDQGNSSDQVLPPVELLSEKALVREQVKQYEELVTSTSEKSKEVDVGQVTLTSPDTVRKKEEKNYAQQFEDIFEIIEQDDLIITNSSSKDEDQTTRKKGLQLYFYTAQTTCTILQERQPSFVIVYDYDIPFIRQIQQYKALNPGIPMRVYFLMYENSSEHQQYTSSLKREKDAFASLIRAKDTIAMPSIDSLIEDMKSMERMKAHVQVSPTSTRKGGSKRRSNSAVEQMQVIVDTREFRSSLPPLLFQRGMFPTPVQLNVGDYILSKNICMERKSPIDLIQSLNVGRLYSQAEKMIKYYKTAALLIQFEEHNPFSLILPSDITDEISGSLIISKLALLTIHFPQLRFFWCRSPHMTAELFKLLKEGEDDPDPEYAAGVGSADATSEDQAETTQLALAVLKKLPGVTDQNVHRITSRVKNLQQLSRCTLEELTVMLDSLPNASKLYEFLNKEMQQ